MNIENIGAIVASAVVGFGVGYFLLNDGKEKYSNASEQPAVKLSTGIIKNVLVCIAMEAEALPLIEKLGLKHRDRLCEDAPSEWYSGEFKDCMVHVVTNGKDRRLGVDNVGTTPAALSVYLSVQKLRPDLIINAGTAGGFMSKGGKIGDIYVSLFCKHHDRRIPIPGFLEYGRGDHKSIPVPKLIVSLGCKKGIVTTSNSLDHTDKDDEQMLENDASVKDMEAAAVAWVAEITDTPMFAIKVVTDLVDGDRPTEEEFFENLQKAAESLQKAIPRALEFVLGKKITEL